MNNHGYLGVTHLKYFCPEQSEPLPQGSDFYPSLPTQMMELNCNYRFSENPFRKSALRLPKGQQAAVGKYLSGR